MNVVWPSERCTVRHHLKLDNQLSISPQMKHGKKIRSEVRKKRRKAMSQKAGKKCEEDVGG